MNDDDYYDATRDLCDENYWYGIDHRRVRTVREVDQLVETIKDAEFAAQSDEYIDGPRHDAA